MVSLYGIFAYLKSFKMDLSNRASQMKAAKSWFEILFLCKYQTNAQIKFNYVE